jgi:transcription elongation factor GreA
VIDEDTIFPKDIVDFGAVVEIEVYYETQDEPERSIFRLVDTDEAESTMRRVSIQSPVGSAIMGLQVGDIADVELPKGDAEIEVLELHYGVTPPKWKHLFPNPFDDTTFQSSVSGDTSNGQNT